MFEKGSNTEPYIGVFFVRRKNMKFYHIPTTYTKPCWKERENVLELLAGQVWIISALFSVDDNAIINKFANHFQLEGKYSLESTDPRESEIRAHLRP